MAVQWYFWWEEGFTRFGRERERERVSRVEGWCEIEVRRRGIAREGGGVGIEFVRLCESLRGFSHRATNTSCQLQKC